MTMTKAAKAVSPLREAFKALMRSPDSRSLKAHLNYLIDRFLTHPSADVKAKFYPDHRGETPHSRP